MTRALNADLHAGRFSVHFATRRKRSTLSAHHSVERTLRAQITNSPGASACLGHPTRPAHMSGRAKDSPIC